MLSYCLVHDKQQKHRRGDEQWMCKKVGQQGLSAVRLAAKRVLILWFS